MGQDAECYQVTADDRAIIINVRSWYIHPFVVPNWTDLRCGFFLSVTDDTADNVITGLGETIVNPGLLGHYDRYWLGLTDMVRGAVFIGFTNTIERQPGGRGDSALVSSDAGIGSGAAYWRPRNSINNAWGAAIYDGTLPKTYILDDNQQHFPQTLGGGGEYAVLLGMQLLRDNPNSNTITVRVKSTTKSADMLFSAAPTKELIQQTFQNWPASKQMGPVTLSNPPNAFYFYWPFHQSRLRVHSLGLLRAA